MSSVPNGVNSYSVDGGEVGRTCRSNTPRSVSSDNLADKTLADIGGISARSSLNRRGPARSIHITFGAHAPAMTFIHWVNAQGSIGLGLLLRRILSAISELTFFNHLVAKGVSNYPKLTWFPDVDVVSVG